MNKTVLVIIGTIVIVIIGIAGFAVYGLSTIPSVGKPTTAPIPTTPSPKPVVEQKAEVPAPVAPQNNAISLAISAPLNGQTVSSPSLKVTGKTVPSADVSVNDKEVKADLKGNFSVLITLDEGENVLMVTAVDQDGNYSDQEVTVTYTPAQ